MASTEFDEARELMRRLVAVANGDGGKWYGEWDGSLVEAVSFRRDAEHGPTSVARLHSDLFQFFHATGATPLLAVRALIAQTPWAGRLL